MQRTTIAILGMGPRGLSILERICALNGLQSFPSDIEVILIDSNDMGTGAHSPNQPDHLLVNTVACQITLFGDTTVKGAGPLRTGPCFHQWANEQGYRNIDGHYVRSSTGNLIGPNEYLPRKLLGEYLHWAYQEFTRDLLSNIHIRQINNKAINILSECEGRSIVVLDNDQQILVDFIYITTGHGRNMPSIDDYCLQHFVSSNTQKNSLLNYYSDPYPIEKLNEIKPNCRVFIQGIGLTAYDVISQFTVGRGGKFTYQDGKLTYLPSGKEPNLALYSRQALPFSSRGVNQKGASGQYSPVFITSAAIEDLRRKNLKDNGNSQLDFSAQVFPLLFKEMCYVYRCTLEGIWADANNWQPGKEEENAILRILYPHEGQMHSNLHDYTRWFKTFLQDDLKSAEEGNVEDPVKAATDVIRDVRDILRGAIDFSGLTPESHQYFLEHYNPIFNRIAVGPPKQRNAQLLALMEAGIITLAGGKNATLTLNSSTGHFEIHSRFVNETNVTIGDIIIKAKIANFSPIDDNSELMRNLISSGTIRPFLNRRYHPGGIDIDVQQHPITSKGQVLKNIWALGNLAEGANFYTYVLPRPQVNSRFLVDAGRCVKEMYQQLAEYQTQVWDNENVA
ncbi:FAD/NAD(P)-binding protein [Xenorhabdus khoisanae]|uniref:FAD/NAD(P)-binding protein n=1 Tax=Xenorhabdus khoisanae TaxID=880157 RepID=UPI0032B80D53